MKGKKKSASRINELTAPKSSGVIWIVAQGFSPAKCFSREEGKVRGNKKEKGSRAHPLVEVPGGEGSTLGGGGGKKLEERQNGE